MFRYKHGKKHAHAGEALDNEETQEVNLHLKNELASPEKNDFFERLKITFLKRLEKLFPKRKIWIIAYFICSLVATGFCFYGIGKDMLPKSIRVSSNCAFVNQMVRDRN